MDFSDWLNGLNNDGSETRFDDWKRYRDNLTSFILDKIKEENKEVLILGVGSSDTLDLEIIDRSVDKLTLADRDKKSMNKLNLKYNLKDKKNIKYKAVDFSGNNDKKLEKKLFNEIFDPQLVAKKDTFQKYLKQLDWTKVVGKLSKHNIVISDCVTTQFLNIINIIEIINENDEGKIEVSKDLIKYGIEEFIPQATKHYNRLCYELLKKDGLLIYITDLIELEDSTYSDGEFILNDDTNDFPYERMILQSKIAIKDLEDERYKLNIIEEKYILWNFAKDKKYIVKIVVYKKY